MISPPSPSPSPPLLLALSGPTSSGKTTLARHLLTIFPNASVLHCDDFYLPEARLPKREGLLDWDCAASLDTQRLLHALKRIKAGEDVNAVRDGVETMELPSSNDEQQQQQQQSGISQALIEELKGKVLKGAVSKRRLVVVDGFLLLGESVKEIGAQFNVKVLLRAKYEDAKRRREGRSGYVTLEGWWEDPPGYFDKVVWPNYVEEHGFLFVNGDVEGEVKEEVIEQRGVSVAPNMTESSLEGTLRWLVDVIQKQL